ncbi:MAG TPA: hypothetical protein VIU39_06710 [Anaerolineales bacterium]|jgi:hypothetical protein
MISRAAHPPIVEISVRLYRAFLTAYPVSFRREYGSQMAQVFEDCCLRAVRQDGTNGMVRLWAVTLLDLIQSVISEHAQKETQMKKEMKPEDIRRAGWSLILGAVSFILILLIAMSPGGSRSQLPVLLFVFACLPLLAYGVLGLRKQYGEKAGSFARNILLIGAILGPVVSVMGLLLAPTGELWFLAWSGPAVLLACLALFGAAALITRPMERWNILPLIAGLPFPALLLYYILDLGPGIPDNATYLVLAVQVIALAALGIILKADAPGEAPLTASTSL